MQWSRNGDARTGKRKACQGGGGQAFELYNHCTGVIAYKELSPRLRWAPHSGIRYPDKGIHTTASFYALFSKSIYDAKTGFAGRFVAQCPMNIFSWLIHRPLIRHLYDSRCPEWSPLPSLLIHSGRSFLLLLRKCKKGSGLPPGAFFFAA